MTLARFSELQTWDFPEKDGVRFHVAAGGHHEDAAARKKNEFVVFDVINFPAGHFAAGLDIEDHDEGVAFSAFARMGSQEFSVGR